MPRIMTTRRQALKMLAGGAGILSDPAIIRPASAAENVVNVTTYDKFVPQSFIDQFQKDTGIEVRIRLTDDQAKQFNVLVAEAGNPTTDIATISGHRVSSYVSRDMLEAIDTSRLKNLGNITSRYQNTPQLVINGGTYGVPLVAAFYPLTRNTQYTKPSDTWGIMFDEQYKGMTTYIIEDFLSIVMFYQGNDGDFVKYVNQPDAAQAAMNQARDLLIQKKHMVKRYYEAGVEVQQMFVNEDVYLAEAWSGPASKLILDNYPIEISVPKEGTIGYFHCFNIVKNAKNADNAYKFIDAMLSSKEIGAEITRNSGFTSTLAGVDTVLNDRERAALSVPQDQLERVQFYNPVNREMLNKMLDKAIAEVKAA